MPDMHIKGSSSTHRDNQGKPLLEQEVTFGKHKGRTLGDLLENERGYLEWLANSDNKKWGPIAKQVLEEGAKVSADPETGEIEDTGDIPSAVIRLAEKAGMKNGDLVAFIQAEYDKPGPS